MNNTKYQRIPLLDTRLLIAAFVIILYAPLLTAGENLSQSNLPLDVVLVLDSSGSMKRTDPREMRKPAAKLFISLLSADDRASVVSFSDQGYPVAFFTAVKGRENEKKLFNAVDRISDKGLYTNLHGAVQGAMRVINRDPLPNRKQIIVLMTDGKMDLGNPDKNNSHSEKLLNELVPQLKSQNIELHTIAFTGESDKAYLEKIALATGGKFNLAQNDKQLHDVYTYIFEQNKQPNMLPFDGEKFTIDNTIKEITIVGSKESRETVLSLLTPDSVRYTADDKRPGVKWFTSEAFDLITIKQPKTGEWRIKESTNKNKAYIVTDLKMQLKVQPQEVAIGEGVIISAWLEDKGKRIEKESVLSTLKMTLQVRTPEGETHTLDMQPQPQGDGSIDMKGVLFNHIAMPTEGRYRLEVVANGGTFFRERNTLVKVVPVNTQNQLSAPESESEKANVEPATQVKIPTAKPEMLAAKTNELPETAVVKGNPGTVGAEPANENTNTESAALAKVPEAKSEVPAAKDKSPNEQLVPGVSSVSETERDTKKVERQQFNKTDAGSNAPEPQEANLAKPLKTFLIVNAVIAMIGTLIYLVYRRKKKKSAQPSFEEIEAALSGGGKKKSA